MRSPGRRLHGRRIARNRRRIDGCRRHGRRGLHSDCLSIRGDYNGDPIAWDCAWPPGQVLGADAKVWSDVGGPNAMFICNDPSGAYQVTVGLKGPAGTYATPDSPYDNYVLVQPSYYQHHLDNRETNAQLWELDLSDFDATAKYTAGTFHLEAVDDGTTGLMQYTAFGTIDVWFDGTFE